MIHHDTHFGNMKVISVCNLCFKPNDTHSHVCPKRVTVGDMQAVGRLEYKDYPDGVYLVELADGTLIAAYLNNDTQDGQGYVDLAYHNDTKAIDPAQVTGLAAVTKGWGQ